MLLLSENVFLDTEVFVAKNFDFSSHKFELLQAAIARGNLFIYLTDIVVRETEKHIVDAVRIARRSLSSTKTDYRILEVCKHFHEAVNDSKFETYEKEILQSFRDFRSKFVKEVIHITHVPIEDLMDCYFQEKPPFNKETKKHEFPDALSLAEIIQWAKENRATAAVVSNDSDIPSLISSLQAGDFLFHYNTIEQLLDSLSATEEKKEQLSKSIQEHYTKLHEELRSVFSDACFHPRGYDAEVVDQELLSAQITEINFLEVREDYALSECEFDCEYRLEIEYDDPDAVFWDSEDKMAYCFNRKRKSKVFTALFYLEVELSKEEGGEEWSVDLISNHISRNVDFDPWE